MGKNGLGAANVRHYVIYDFKGKAPRSLYRLRERLESDGAAEWIQYSVARTNRLDVALRIANFCLGSGLKWKWSRGSGAALSDGERSPLVCGSNVQGPRKSIRELACPRNFLDTMLA